MKCRKILLTLLVLALPALLSLAFLGCEIQAADSVVRDILADLNGVYLGNFSNAVAEIIREHTGDPIRWLDLRQTGDQLEAIDNNDQVFSGTVGDYNGTADSGVASITLTGRTTDGNEGTISGTIEVEDSSRKMRGTWMEAARYSIVSGDATGTTPPTPSDVVISPGSATVSSNGNTVVFSALGGSGDYTWRLDNYNRGTLNATTGDSVTYTRTASGDNTITVNDSNDPTDEDSAFISQP